jgi:hypothetical protein
MKSEDERIENLLKKKKLLETHQKHKSNEFKIKIKSCIIGFVWCFSLFYFSAFGGLLLYDQWKIASTIGEWKDVPDGFCDYNDNKIADYSLTYTITHGSMVTTIHGEFCEEHAILVAVKDNIPVYNLDEKLKQKVVAYQKITNKALSPIVIFFGLIGGFLGSILWLRVRSKI